jgi:hypothetical protein
LYLFLFFLFSVVFGLIGVPALIMRKEASWKSGTVADTE